LKRTRRILINSLTAASALLCVATITLWVRGHYARDTYTQYRRYDNTLVCKTISCGRGQFTFFWSRMQYGRGRWPAAWGTPDAFWDTIQRRKIMPYPGWDSDYPQLPFVFRQVGVSGPGMWWCHFFHHVTPYAGTSFVHSARVITVPFWILLAATAALPAWKLRAIFREYRHNRRRRGGFCGSCGYDLRATPQRCPECGAVPANI